MTRGNSAQACASWFAQPEPPASHADRLLVAECLADGRDPRAPQFAALLAAEQPIETDLALATWLANSGHAPEAGERLLALARERGYERVSLETGTMDAFAPARALYRSAGFVPCAPFGEHTANANSVCMSLRLAENTRG